MKKRVFIALYEREFHTILTLLENDKKLLFMKPPNFVPLILHSDAS